MGREVIKKRKKIKKDNSDFFYICGKCICFHMQESEIGKKHLKYESKIKNMKSIEEVKYNAKSTTFIFREGTNGGWAGEPAILIGIAKENGRKILAYDWNAKGKLFLRISGHGLRGSIAF